MKSLYSLLIIFILFNVTAFHSACSNDLKPKLKLSHLEIIFDTVLANSSKVAEISIYNVGKSDLLIQDYSSSCECTIINLKPNTVIKPQDSILLELKIDASSEDTGRWTHILCTFKSNSDSTFTYLPISYFTIAKK